MALLHFSTLKYPAYYIVYKLWSKDEVVDGQAILAAMCCEGMTVDVYFYGFV